MLSVGAEKQKSESRAGGGTEIHQGQTREKGEVAMAHFDDPETQKANMAYIKRSMRQPLLDRQHELDLARRWRDEGDEAALHELVIAYSRLVISIASRFRNYGLPLGDLIQEGNIGLMQAAARFEPERDVRFSTYASGAGIRRSTS
eukprot:TRINITY_DN24041_c0_g1_i6.p1 TRINITY_DN24041_c0_g1~~TRINITY_DN24041_c0_g1_i6.p1  ORF type:complete len:146 (-),score=2.80 TRINITY_DN24041_c0_g1_i6:66-503(-)